jgi:cell division control protein 11
MEDIDHYEIPVYNFPYDIEEDDEELSRKTLN